MPPKRAVGADDGTRGKKHKHKSLCMLKKTELLKQLVKRSSVKTLCEYYGIGSSTVYDQGLSHMAQKHVLRHILNIVLSMFRFMFDVSRLDVQTPMFGDAAV